MKSINQFLSILLLMVLVQHSGFAQQTGGTNGLVVKEAAFDFGRIPQGKPVFHVFEIKNTGKAALQVTDVQASCGCTTPVWHREMIQPGGTSSIKIGYNAADAGMFEKGITVFYGQGETLMITIRGDVWKTPDQPAPSNKSVELLKKMKTNSN